MNGTMTPRPTGSGAHASAWTERGLPTADTGKGSRGQACTLERRARESRLKDERVDGKLTRYRDRERVQNMVA